MQLTYAHFPPVTIGYIALVLGGSSVLLGRAEARRPGYAELGILPAGLTAFFLWFINSSLHGHLGDQIEAIRGFSGAWLGPGYWLMMIGTALVVVGIAGALSTPSDGSIFLFPSNRSFLPARATRNEQTDSVHKHLESSSASSRSSSGQDELFGEAWVEAGCLGLGYIRDRDKKQIVPDPARIDVVRRIFQMYAEQRMGAEAIARVLNAEGHRSKNGVPFARPNVLQIQRNPVYVGRVVFRGKVHPGRHEPIIDEQTFETVQAILAVRGESQALKRGHASDYLLSGVLRCGRCRKAYVGTAAQGRRNRFRYYICSTRYR